MITKFASATIIDAKMASGGTMMRTSHRHEFNYEPKTGFLYVRSRAISSRTNDNFDHFPAEEIKKAYRTFVGKPVFVNHHNENHRRARGVIVDAALHEDVNADGSQDTWAEVLMEVDAVNFPMLAKAIIAGEIDRTSMGTDVEFSVCSICNNKASSPVEYCSHIPRSKGMKVRRTTASGVREDVLCYEKCYGLGFFENSLLVEEPADPTAYFLGVDARGMQSTASKDAPRRTASYEDMTDREFASALYAEAERLANANEEAMPVYDLVDAFDGGSKEWYAKVARSDGVNLPYSLTQVALQRSASKTSGFVDDLLDLARGGRDPRHQCMECGTSFRWDASEERFRCPEGHSSIPAMASRKTAQIPDYLLEAWYRENEWARPPQNSSSSPFSGRDLLNPDDPEDEDIYVTWEPDRLNPGPNWDRRDLLARERHSSIQRAASRRTQSSKTAAGAPNVPGDYAFVRFDSHRSRDKWERYSGGESSNWITLVSFSGPEMVAIPRSFVEYQQGAGGNTMKGVTVYKRPPNLDGYMRPLNDRRAVSRRTASKTASNPAEEAYIVEVDPGRWYFWLVDTEYDTEILRAGGPFGDVEAAWREATHMHSPSSRVVWSHPHTPWELDPEYLSGYYLSAIKRQASKTAEQTLAPAKVDTLRDEACPVCGESDSYDGEKCRVCNFIRPPDEFADPDLSKAKENDLRQDQQEEVEAPVEPEAEVTGGPDYLKKEIPLGGAEEGTAGTDGAAWKQRTIPKDSAEAEEPGEAAADVPLWKQKTRRKSAGSSTQKE